MRNALNLPAMQERLKQLGAMPLPISAAEFGRFYQADIDRWAGLVRTGKVAKLN